MLIYYFLLAVLALLALVEAFYYKGKKPDPILYAIVCLLLVLFAALRKIGIDNDSQMYSEWFHFFSKHSLSYLITENEPKYIEPGYILLNKCVAYFGGGIRLVLAIMAIATGGLTYTFFYRKTSLPFLSLFFYAGIFFLIRDFTQIRYALSGALSFWVVSFFIDRRLVYAGICFFIGVMFHNAMLILLPALIIATVLKNVKVYLLFPLIGIMIGLVFNALEVIKSLGISSHSIDWYLKNDTGGSNMLAVFGFFTVCAYLLLGISKDKANILYLKMILIGISLNFLFYQSPILQRFSFLLMQFTILILSGLILHLMKGRIDKKLFLVLYLFFTLFLLAYSCKSIQEDFIRPYEINYLWR